jgi:uncharacterized spore protein YtfJ
MTAIKRLIALALLTAMPAVVGSAQTPLAKPLADFDKLVAELKTGSLVAEPIRAGDTTVIPFAAVKFGVGGGSVPIASGGGMGVQTVPLGALIIEGDTVRIERFGSPEAKPSFAQELIQAIHDRKLIIGNGLNFGSVSGNVQALEPLMKDALGQSTIIGNGFNIGGITIPMPPAGSTKTAAPPAGKK